MSAYGRIRGLLSRKKLDGFLISELVNIRYLTGFAGSSAALYIGKGETLFFTDFRYRTECESLLKNEELMIIRDDLLKGVNKTLRARGVRRVGFEYGASYRTFDILRKEFELESLKDVVEQIRERKDQEEMRNIGTAVARAEDAFMEIKGSIRAGVKELKIALLLEERLKRKGCKVLPFDIIVASGKNAALPHAKVSEKKIDHGDLVVVDWGAECEGYMSDMTRTFLIRGGEKTAVKKKIYRTVLRANRKGLECVHAGARCKDVDERVRSVIRDGGFGEHFGHATGHGVGLRVHEKPSLSQRSKEVLRPGMVITVEPGIYIPEVGGVRIEDMMHVSNGTSRRLTSLPKSLEIL